jgi:hypothetical protein
MYSKEDFESEREIGFINYSLVRKSKFNIKENFN